MIKKQKFKKSNAIEGILDERKKFQKKAYSFRFPQELMNKLHEEAERLNKSLKGGEPRISATELIEKMIRDFLEN